MGKQGSAKRTWLEWGTDVLLLFLLLYGTGEALRTGFRMPFPARAAILFSVCTALLMSTAAKFLKKRGLTGALFSVLLLLWGFLHAGKILRGFLYVFGMVYSCLNIGYQGKLKYPAFLLRFGITSASLAENAPEAKELSEQGTEFLLFLLGILAVVFFFSFLYQRHSVLPAVLPVPFFVLCFLVIDITLPSSVSLVCLMLYWVLLLFTASVRRLSPAAAARQTAFCILPVLLLFLCVTLFCPQEGFVRGTFRERTDEILSSFTDTAKTVQEQAEKLFSGSADAIFPWMQNAEVEGDTISLTDMGKRRFSEKTVMTVTAEHPGTLYLRSNTYSQYWNNQWSEPDSREKRMNGALVVRGAADTLEKLGVRPYMLTLENARADTIFTPYFFYGTSAEFSLSGDRCLYNRNHIKDYQVWYCEPSFDFSALSETDRSPELAAYENQLKSRGTEVYSVPDDTMAFLQTLVSEKNLIGKTKQETVRNVTAYVRECASYSLEPSEMPKGTKDFAVWFLTEAESGFCTHFATAEVLLLRACGIGARLAVGYLVEAGEGPTAVLDSDAHAWAEYFDGRIGWVPAEATPAADAVSDEKTERRPTGLPAVSRTDSGEDGNGDTPILPQYTGEDGEGQKQTETTEKTENPEIGEKPIYRVGEDGSVKREEKGTDKESGTDGSGTESGDDTGTEKGNDTDDAGTARTDSEENADTEKAQDSGHVSADTSEDVSGKEDQRSDDSRGDGETESPSILRYVILGIIVFLALLSVFPIRRYLRMRRFRRNTDIGNGADGNRAALIWYGYCLRLARAGGQALPEELTRLAERAKFSQHRLTPEELSVFSAWYRAAADARRKKDSAFMRFYHKWIDIPF